MNELSPKLFELIDINGGPYWSRSDGNIYTPNGFSTIDFLNVFADIGLTVENKDIREAVDYVFKLYDDKSKSFRYAPKSSKLPCINAKILSVLSRLGVKDKRIKEATLELMKLQQPDGGWRCSTVRVGRSSETDASNPGTTLYVLDLMNECQFFDLNCEELENGVLFLLKHWITRKPLGPCGFGIGTTFQKTEYPFYRYNIFYYSYVLSFYQKAQDDERFNEIIKILDKKSDGKNIIIENQHKKWKDLLFSDSNACVFSDKKYSIIKENLL